LQDPLLEHPRREDVEHPLALFHLLKVRQGLHSAKEGFNQLSRIELNQDAARNKKYGEKKKGKKRKILMRWVDGRVDGCVGREEKRIDRAGTKNNNNTNAPSLSRTSTERSSVMR
jgi:hypothetical protein